MLSHLLSFIVRAYRQIQLCCMFSFGQILLLLEPQKPVHDHSMYEFLITMPANDAVSLLLSKMTQSRDTHVENLLLFRRFLLLHPEWCAKVQDMLVRTPFDSAKFEWTQLIETLEEEKKQQGDEFNLVWELCREFAFPYQFVARVYNSFCDQYGLAPLPEYIEDDADNDNDSVSDDTDSPEDADLDSLQTRLDEMNPTLDNKTRDVQTICSQTGVDNQTALTALRKYDGNVEHAILDLTHGEAKFCSNLKDYQGSPLGVQTFAECKQKALTMLHDMRKKSKML